MSDASASLARMKLNVPITPVVEISFAHNLDFFWFIVCPKSAVASTDGTQALDEGLVWGWRSESDCFIVAG